MARIPDNTITRFFAFSLVGLGIAGLVLSLWPSKDSIELIGIGGGLYGLRRAQKK